MSTYIKVTVNYDILYDLHNTRRYVNIYHFDRFRNGVFLDLGMVGFFNVIYKRHWLCAVYVFCLLLKIVHDLIPQQPLVGMVLPLPGSKRQAGQRSLSTNSNVFQKLPHKDWYHKGLLVTVDISLWYDRPGLEPWTSQSWGGRTSNIIIQ